MGLTKTAYATLSPRCRVLNLHVVIYSDNTGKFFITQSYRALQNISKTVQQISHIPLVHYRFNMFQLKRPSLGNNIINSENSVINKRLYALPLALGHAVAQLVEALRYKPEGRGFDFRWCHWNFSLT